MFTKNDLRNGDFVTRRNGEEEVFIESLGVFVSKYGYMSIETVNTDLTEKDEFDNEWDIVKVRRPVKNYHCQFGVNGGDIVYDRERDTKRYYNGKVVCVSHNGTPLNDRLYTIGKIYQFVDGSFKDDQGDNLKDWTTAFESFEEFKNWSSSEWIEIVE